MTCTAPAAGRLSIPVTPARAFALVVATPMFTELIEPIRQSVRNTALINNVVRCRVAGWEPQSASVTQRSDGSERLTGPVALRAGRASPDGDSSRG